MNIFHNLAPEWPFTVAVMIAIILLLWGALLFLYTSRKSEFIELDELERLIEQRNKHCRIKAEYDEHG